MPMTLIEIKKQLINADTGGYDYEDQAARAIGYANDLDFILSRLLDYLIEKEKAEKAGR